MLSKTIWPSFGKCVLLMVCALAMFWVPTAGDSNGRHAMPASPTIANGDSATSDQSKQQKAELQVYGGVTMTAQEVAAPGHLLRFDLATPALAETFLSQLHADMTWDDMVGPKTVTLAGNVPAIQTASSLLVLARLGATVYAASGPTPAAVEQVLGQAGLTAKGADFKVDTHIPASLNFTDLQPLYANVHQLHRFSDDAAGFARFDPQVLDGPYEFWRQRHIPFSFNTRASFGLNNLADGPPEIFPTAYEIAQARKIDSPIYAWFGPWLAPWWIRNEFPHDLLRKDPQGISLWNPVGAEASTALDLCCASENVMSYVARNNLAWMQFLKKAAGDSLSGIRISSGWPGDELALHLFSTEMLGFSDVGEQGFRRWLQTKSHLDLAQLGERWYGDSHRFANWNQVMLPSMFSFFGDFRDGSFDLLQDWRWRPDLPQAMHEGWWREDFQPGKDWAEVDLTPSKGQLFLFGSELDKTGWRQGDSTVAWFRRSFDPGAWLAKAQAKGQQVYLVADTYGQQPVQVFFNGKDLGPMKINGYLRAPIGVKVTGLAKPGQNILVLKVPSGMIPGPVFLTTHEPALYPYADWHKNARWVDMRDWLLEQLVEGYIRVAGTVVRADPDLPVVFNPGGSTALVEHLLEIKRRIGMRVICNTGGEASFRPQWPGFGYALGFYGGSEESATNRTPAGLTEELGWLMFNGESNHTFVYTSEHYQKIEEQSHWFSDHRRELEMFGKAAWTKPQVALFVSGRESDYFPYSDVVGRWDLGRGRIQRTYFNNVYLSEEEIRNGMAEGYPVLIDGNNQALDKPTLDALERYVRQGGTYVTLNLTGQHSTLHANSWPIEQLTGCKVAGQRRNMRVRIVKDNPLLKHLAGQVFQDNSGAGSSARGASTVNPELFYDSFNSGAGDFAGGTPSDMSFALASKNGIEFKPLALWEDGTVAAGVRYLGKGRVVALASTFWKKSSDRTGAALPGGLETAFLSDLLHGLGLVPPLTTSDPDVWANRFITKDGLQDWMMMLNSTPDSKPDVTLRFQWPHDPATVYDAVSGKPVAYTWRDGIVTVPNLTLGPHDLRALAVNNGDFQSAVEHWFAIKAKYDVRLPSETLQAIPAPPPLPPAGMLVLEHLQFRQAQQAGPESDTAWASEDDQKAPWKRVDQGFWEDLGYQARGLGYYRESFNLPSAWQGRRVIVALASFDGPVFLQDADVYCNGKLVGNYKADMWANFTTLDLTSLLHPGQNELGVRVRAEQARGAYLGQVIIFPLRKYTQNLDLTDWAIYRDPLKFRTVTLPIEQTPVRNMRTQIMVPADWPADHIFLRFEGKTRWVSCIVVNGQPIGFNQSLHPYGQIAEVNLYPWIKPGQINTIELWAVHTIPNDRGMSESRLANVSLSRVVLGVD